MSKRARRSGFRRGRPESRELDLDEIVDVREEEGRIIIEPVRKRPTIRMRASWDAEVVGGKPGGHWPRCQHPRLTADSPYGGVDA
jgi:hypothetical protein